MNSYSSLTSLKRLMFSSQIGAGDTPPTAFDEDLIDSLEEGSREFEIACNRYFYLFEGTRYYDGGGIRVIMEDDIYSITSMDVDTDGDGVYESNYILDTSGATQPDVFTYPRPKTVYWPKTRIEANPWGRYGHFGSGIRAAIKITGVFGFGNDYPMPAYLPCSTLSAGINAAVLTIPVTSGALFSKATTIRIGSEQMYVLNITSSDLIVEARGINGTTAASHGSGDVVNVYQFPKAVEHAVTIYAMRCWKRKDSMYQNVVVNPEFGTVDVWKGDDPDWKSAVKMYLRRQGPGRYVG